jgi:hypothetical protein
MWLNSKGFVKRVKQWWVPYSFHGSLRFVLVRKLKALKINLKKWNEQVFDNVEKQKNVLLDEL